MGQIHVGMCVLWHWIKIEQLWSLFFSLTSQLYSLKLLYLNIIVCIWRAFVNNVRLAFYSVLLCDVVFVRHVEVKSLCCLSTLFGLIRDVMWFLLLLAL